MTHGDTSTYPRKASDFGFIPLSHVLEVAAAVVSTQRDWGNQVNRKNAKTKYTLERVGVEAFKAEVESRAGIQFGPVRPMSSPAVAIASGWVEGSMASTTSPCLSRTAACWTSRQAPQDRHAGDRQGASG